MGYLTQASIGGSDYVLANGLYGTCSTAAGTAAKVVTLADFDSLEDGVTVHVKFTYSNTASNATLQVGSSTAKNLCMYGTTRVGTTEETSWKAGAVVAFTYDGTSWVMNDYIPDTDTKNTAGSTNSSSKLFLIGATSNGSSATNPQTYSNSKVYATNGALVCDTISTDGSNSYDLGAACAKGVDTSISSGSTSVNLPTTAAVADYVDSAVSTASSGALTYRGTVTSQSDITGTNYKKGWYWVVAMPDAQTSSITIAGKECEAGDMVIAKQDKTASISDDVDIVQSNIEVLTTTEIDALWAAA